MGVYDNTVYIEEMLTPVEVKSGEAFADKIKEQGPQVEAVNWIWEKVKGESLIESIITPMTGDWAKIAANGEAWINAANAIEQISGNLSDNVAKLDPHWEGEAAAAFERHIDVLWALALYAEAAVARLIFKGFNFVSEQSEKLCQSALNLLTQFINMLLKAIGWAFVPFAGWARAVAIVDSLVDIYSQIKKLIKDVEIVVRAVETLFNSALKIKNALAELPDVRSLSDAIELGQEVKRGTDAVKESAKEVQEDVTGVEEDMEKQAPR